ncbi:DUF695 domain-containing protein [Flavobacterium procerum]|uniref:DUF695 domain-containing protein n=1 Tax=Flavobacterium procerum TaxID=1455569 RepID=A0ABV6BMZ7_9FLAO
MKNNWAIRLIEVEGFTATATVNKGYLEFQDKDKFPFLLSVELSLLETENDLPTEKENARLIEIEENLLNIFKSTQQVHYVGHITRKGFRDILCYVGSEDLDGEAIGAYCDSIEAEREIAIDINEDSEWETAENVLG